jgi:hypothetical protein
VSGGGTVSGIAGGITESGPGGGGTTVSGTAGGDGTESAGGRTGSTGSSGPSEETSRSPPPPQPPRGSTRSRNHVPLVQKVISVAPCRVGTWTNGEPVTEAKGKAGRRARFGAGIHCNFFHYLTYCQGFSLTQKTRPPSQLGSGQILSSVVLRWLQARTHLVTSKAFHSSRSTAASPGAT